MGVFEKLKLAKFATELKKLKGDVVYFPGCATQKYLPEIAENYKTILTDLGIPIKVMEPWCCGKPLKEQGYTKEYKEHVSKIKAMLEKDGVKTIVTSCASCCQALKEDYGVDVRHTTDVIWHERHKLQQFNKGEVTIQDNCVGARKLGLLNQSRDILVQTGYDIKEFSECKQSARCCGGSCGLANNASAVSTKLAQRRIRDAPANTIVTDDPHCYIQLKKSTQNKEVLELSETLIEI